MSAVYSHPASLTYMHRTSHEMPGWIKHKLKSRLLGQNQKYRPMEQDREPIDKPTHMGYLIFDKGGKNTQWGKDSLFKAQRRGRCWPGPETTWAETRRETHPGFLLSSALPPALRYCPSRVRNLPQEAWRCSLQVTIK